MYQTAKPFIYANSSKRLLFGEANSSAPTRACIQLFKISLFIRFIQPCPANIPIQNNSALGELSESNTYFMLNEGSS